MLVIKSSWSQISAQLLIPDPALNARMRLRLLAREEPKYTPLGVHLVWRVRRLHFEGTLIDVSKNRKTKKRAKDALQ